MVTTYTVTGPSSGSIGEPQTYSVALGSGTLANPVTIVVNSNGAPGSVQPSQIRLTNDNRIATFTYTRQTAGQTLLSFTNSGDLVDPDSLVYTATIPVVTRYVVSGPSTGAVGQPQTISISLLHGFLAEPVTITVTASGDCVVSPGTVQLTNSTRAALVQLTALSKGQCVLQFSNNGQLSDSVDLLYTAIEANTGLPLPEMPNSEGRCGVAVPGVPNSATVEDFITAFTLVEAIELSNLDSGGSAIDCNRLNKALLDAYTELASAKLLLSAQAGRVIDANLNRWMLIIARYYLDSVRRRPDVTADYERVVNKLAELSNSSGDATGGAARVYNHNGKRAVFTQESLKHFTSRTHGIL